jgi:hypothetical protein
VERGHRFLAIDEREVGLLLTMATMAIPVRQVWYSRLPLPQFRHAAPKLFLVKEGQGVPSKQQQFASKVQELIKQSKSLPPQARKHVLELLDEARKRIIGELATLNPDSFTAVQRQQLKSSIDRAFDYFRVQSTQRVSSLEGIAAQVGIASVDAPLSAAGMVSGFGQVSAQTLSIVQGYTADLIGGLSQKAAADINATIQRAFLGGQNMTDIIAQASAALGEDSPLADRAIRLTNNEILRVQSIATQGRMEDLAGRHPDLRKRWKHIPVAKVPRVGHVIIDGQLRKVDEPFDVEGEQLMYPRDPAGSAENTINCHCLSVPEMDLTPTAQEKDLLKSLGLSVVVSSAA